ncbi:hypothetical protein V6N11_013931 [Hibiscus sabdariffa]|uniref:Uncharacterized protein n=1 Tax=Hibiscus sabdariffa TaxID=183260 RepID=A0ABR2A2E7_9ROSI
MVQFSSPPSYYYRMVSERELGTEVSSSNGRLNGKPCFGDQFLNMRYICYVWKIGLRLENVLERGNVEDAIRTLMVNIQGEEMRNRAMEFKAKTELCLREGGSSSSSLDEFTKLISSV